MIQSFFSYAFWPFVGFLWENDGFLPFCLVSWDSHAKNVIGETYIKELFLFLKKFHNFRCYVNLIHFELHIE